MRQYFYLRRRRRSCFRVCLSVCLFAFLFVCLLDFSKSCERIWVKLFGLFGCGSETKWLDFDGDLC